MKRLDSILEQAIEKALEAAAVRAEALALEALEPALKAALEARLRALLEAPAAPAVGPAAPAAPIRARAKVTPEAPASEAKAPRRRAKAAKAAGTPETDMTTLMGGVEAALAKYKGLSTPRGKPLEEVLARRVRRTLQYAQGLGREDLPSLARSSLAVIAADPMGVAMRPWPALAIAMGLPDPIAAKVE
jgi:hypothetical protein